MIVINNISQILTITNNELGIIENGSIVIERTKIKEVIANPKFRIPNAKVIDANSCIVLPGFIDCHTHLVYAGSRENEFALRLQGKSYKEILNAGGGILQTVTATRQASEKELFYLTQKRIEELIQWGTTTVEIKSGYGLDTDNEIKLLKVIKNLRQANKDRVTIIPTFLGAHAIPPNTPKHAYIRALINEMLPRIAKQRLAQFCDVFCENFVFNAKDSEKILIAAKRLGLIPKIHADEIESSGGAEVSAKVGAISAEHLLYPSDNGLKAMSKKGVIAVLLPGTSLFLKSKQLPPIEKMRRFGITIALGSDYNPGSCMIYQMPIIIGLGCLLYNLSIVEAIRGATINAAKALGLDNKIGSIEPGKDADLIILSAPNYQHIPYQFGRNLVTTVIKKGKVIFHKQ